MNHIDKFYTYLKELDESYAKLSELLRQKLTALSNSDLARLDEIIKDEQVYVLLAKGFDQNLQSHRDRLNLKGEDLSSVIEELPEEHRDAFRRQHERLRSTLGEVKTLNQKCQSLIEDRLYSLDKRIKELDKSSNATYGKAGGSPAGPQPGSSIFTKSV